MAVWATNVPQWVILQFATARIGAVLVTINPAYRPFELQYVLEQSDAVGLVPGRAVQVVRLFRHAGRSLPGTGRMPSPASLQCAAFPRLRWVVVARGRAPGRRHHLARDARARPERAGRADWTRLGRDCSPRQPINIQYTSGTTGFPKAATLSHRNLLLNAFYVGQCQRLDRADRICIPVPFYHCFGCVLGTLCAVVHGAAMIVPAESFNPTATLDAIERERATAIYGVPTMYIAQLQDPTFAQPRSVARCGRASCRAAPARSKSCSKSSTGWGSAKSRSPTARPKPRR